jgi:cellobiose phosphorylase
MTLLASRFGHFDDGGNAYTLTDPAVPVPWVNVICNGRYGLVISHNGGGFSWLDDAQHNVITRWEMDLVRDQSGRFIYLSDLDTGQVWSVTPSPCQTRHDHYRCTHRPGSTTFATAAHGIQCQWTLAVSQHHPCEVWLLELTNTGKATRNIRVASFFEWCCGVAPDSKREFHRLFFEARYDPARRAIFAGKTMWAIPPKSEREHWNTPWPFAAAHAAHGPFERTLAIGDKAAFLGRFASASSPRAMRGATPPAGPFGRFGDAAAALGGDLTLAPGQTVRVHFVLAADSDGARVSSVLDAFASWDAASAAVREAESAWAQRLAPFRVQSGRPDFDLLNNTWLTYQAISGRLWGRTGYYQQSGARGFRDQLQDSQVWLPLDPARTLDQALLHASRQATDGSVNHWWHALADFGNRTACSDDYLWLAFVTASYLRETGDFDALQRRAPFLDDPAGGTLEDHCARAIARARSRVSARGLPLIGSCDWNDGLSAMGVEGRGESVWLAMFLAHILADWAIIADRTGNQRLAGEYRAARENLARAVNALAWDGEWYRYGTKDSGEWVGSSSSRHGRIHLNAQTWAIISDIAPAARAQAAWESVKRHLLSPFGPLLLAPAYTSPDPDIGYITRYAPGSRENGGVYMHAATWALQAAAKVGDAGAVARVWDSISPPWRGRDPERYWAEPYVMPGNVDGPLSDLPGRAGWTWYTGSAAWLGRVSQEWVLGIRPTWHGLLIDPCPPESLGRVQVTRRWRGVPVHVSFDAGDFVPGRRPVVTRLGAEVPGGLITPEMARACGGEVRVHVAWAPEPQAVLHAPRAVRSTP